MTLFGIKIGVKLLAIAGVALLVILALTLGPAACNRIRGLEAQSKVDAGQSGAFHNSAGDASRVQDQVNQNSMASEDLTRRNAEEIRNAKGANVAVDPDLDAALVRAFCRRPSAAHDPKCRLLVTNTR